MNGNYLDTLAPFHPVVRHFYIEPPQDALKKTTTNKPTKKHLFKGQTNSHVTGERIASKEAEA